MDDYKRMAVFCECGAARLDEWCWACTGHECIRREPAGAPAERDGGVTLLHRSTRKLGLTEAGERFHNRCAAMVLAAEQARAEMNASRDAPSGVLRLSAPVGFARHVAPALGALLANNPALRLRVMVDDAPIDLIESRIDLAIRFGHLADLDLGRTAPAVRCSGGCVHSPAWLAGTPEHPDALLAHQWLGFTRETE